MMPTLHSSTMHCSLTEMEREEKREERILAMRRETVI